MELKILGTVLERSLEMVLAWIASKTKGKFFDAEKWVGRDIIIESSEIKKEALRKEYWEALPYPFDRVGIRVPLDNRSRYDVELKELFLRIFVNNAPLKYIIWSKKEKEVGIKNDYTDTEFELYAWNTENFVFRKNKEGALDFYIHLPPYVNTRGSSVIYIKLIGYAIFDSSFGEFTKKIFIDTKIAREDWKPRIKHVVF